MSATRVRHRRGPRDRIFRSTGVLLDSGNPDLAVKELGGTGRVHNWEISRRLIETSTVPVFLAGGITKQNAAEAITATHPFGLDLCSGVRTDEQLDTDKLAAFMEAVHAAV